MNNIEALQRAFDALGPTAPECCGCAVEWEIAITSIRQAIEQAQKQEPVAWMYPDALCDRACLYLCTKGFTHFPECATSPSQHQWVGLTDEEMQAVVDAQPLVSSINVYFRAIEAKLKEKNNV
jgi:hypothetical protein